MAEQSKKEDGGQKKFHVIILCKKGDSPEGLQRTRDAFLKQERSGTTFQLKLTTWCVEDCSRSVLDLAHQTGINMVQASSSFLSNLPESLTICSQKECTSILLCSCGVVPKQNCISFLLSKISEYGDDTILSAFGIRIFPHEKLYHVGKNLKEGIHWKLYSDAKDDRAVDVFTADLCYVSMDTLRRISAYSSQADELCQLDCLWCSFVAGHHLNFVIWKIKMDQVADFSYTHTPYFSKGEEMLTDKFYSHVYDNDWPSGVSNPIYSTEKVRMAQLRSDPPSLIWEKGFGGINMPSEPASELDFAAAATVGVKVIRIGAVRDAKDLAYLIAPNATSFKDDKAHLLQVLPYLKDAVCKAGSYGLKVVITMTDLPGCGFHSQEDCASFLFWDSPVCRQRAAKFWGVVAEGLADNKNYVMGYDLINEPYTSEDTIVSFFDEISITHQDELHQFHLDALEEIRKYDKETTVIVKGTWFASPIAIESLLPLSDPNVAYAFHVYVPPVLALHRRYGMPGYSYPGPVPRWPYCHEEMVDINKKFLHDMFRDTIYNWQLKHGIPSSRIVAAEFGICREVPGACQYLKDLADIFGEFRWSWLLFSFRDDEWDALDYELGPNLDNMLNRSASEMFLAVAEHFH